MHGAGLLGALQEKSPGTAEKEARCALVSRDPDMRQNGASSRRLRTGPLRVGLELASGSLPKPGHTARFRERKDAATASFREPVGAGVEGVAVPMERPTLGAGPGR